LQEYFRRQREPMAWAKRITFRGDLHVSIPHRLPDSAGSRA
jgi:hypothetical protein